MYSLLGTNNLLCLHIGTFWSCTDSITYVGVADLDFTNAQLSDGNIIAGANYMNMSLES